MKKFIFATLFSLTLFINPVMAEEKKNDNKKVEIIEDADEVSKNIEDNIKTSKSTVEEKTQEIGKNINSFIKDSFDYADKVTDKK